MIASLDVEGELFASWRVRGGCPHAWMNSASRRATGGTDFPNVYVYVGSVARTKVQRCGAQMQSWRDCPVIRISDGAN